MRIITYNVHNCLGQDGKLRPERIAEVIATSGADVVCLQEVDAWRERSGRVHQAGIIAEALRMTYQFFPAIRAEDEEYGDAILSRHPMTLVRSGGLPCPHMGLEPRGALWVEIDDGKTKWQVLNTHFGLGRFERRTQARMLAGWLAEALEHPPVIFCGDLNSRSGSLVHSILGTGLRDAQKTVHGRPSRTFSTRFPWICLDYIYVSDGVSVSGAQVIDTPLTRIASDHFPLVAQAEHL